MARGAGAGPRPAITGWSERRSGALRLALPGPQTGEVVVLTPLADGRVVLATHPRSALEEEREFLLRSLRDLEAEHDAGDIDDADYGALKDDYTVRAAVVLRQLTTSPPQAGAPVRLAPAERPRRWPGWALRAAAAVLAGSLAGWAVVSASGTRQGNEPVSGVAIGPAKVGRLLSQAQTAAAKGDAVTALRDCRAILAGDPNQPQALGEEGWVLAQTQRAPLVTQGLRDLNRAVGLAPTDTTAHLYRGIVLLDLGRKTDAVGDLQYYLDHHPDPQVMARVESALAQARAGAPGSPAPAPPSPSVPGPSVPPAG